MSDYSRNGNPWDYITSYSDEKVKKVLAEAFRAVGYEIHNGSSVKNAFWKVANALYKPPESPYPAKLTPSE